MTFYAIVTVISRTRSGLTGFYVETESFDSGFTAAEALAESKLPALYRARSGFAAYRLQAAMGGCRVTTRHQISINLVFLVIAIAAATMLLGSAWTRP